MGEINLMKILMSLIIPIFNSENTIERCLDSIISQNTDKIEIILINDGSTDKSVSIVEHYISTRSDIRILLYHKKNGGAASSRNFGLSKASGEFIWFIDGDDTIDKNALSQLYDILTNENADIIYFNYVRKYVNCEEIIHVNKYHNLPLDCSFILQACGPWNLIVKKLYYNKINFSFPQNMIYEDLGSISTLVLHTDKIKFVDSVLYCYIQNAFSVMRNGKRQFQNNYDDIYKAISFILKKFKQENKFDIYIKELEFLVILHLLYYGGMRFLDSNLDRNQKNERIENIRKLLDTEFTEWKRNNYIKQESFKIKFITRVIYNKHYTFYNLLCFIKKRESRKVLYEN